MIKRYKADFSIHSFELGSLDESNHLSQFKITSKTLKPIYNAKLKLKIKSAGIRFKHVKSLIFRQNGGDPHEGIDPKSDRVRRILLSNVVFPDKHMKGWIIISIPYITPMAEIDVKMVTEKAYEESNLVVEVLSGSRVLFSNEVYSQNKIFAMIFLMFLVIGAAFAALFMKMYAK
jgi:hypothetical protein